MLQILLNCARADLVHALAMAEATGDPAYQRDAIEARESVEALSAMLRVPA